MLLETMGGSTSVWSGPVSTAQARNALALLVARFRNNSRTELAQMTMDEQKYSTQLSISESWCKTPTTATPTIQQG